jgi:uncharacterized delta-60 repeat protein
MRKNLPYKIFGLVAVLFMQHAVNAQTCSLPPLFGDGGKSFVNFLDGTHSIGQEAIQLADGNILMSGSNGIAKINAVDGSFVNSFGANGKISLGGITDIAEQADGKIVGIGASGFVFRINSNGSLDMGFGVNGFVKNLIAGQDITIQSDGKIIVAGTVYNGSNDFAVARYNADGSPDNSFDGDGKVITSIGTSDDMAYSVAIQSDGKIVVGGYSVMPGKWVFALVCYNTDGSLDNSFDTDGIATAAFTNTVEGWSAISIQTDGKIVQAGKVRLSGSQTVIAVARYNSNGSLDNSFDGDGELTTSMGQNDEADAVVIQTDGKIMVTGITSASALAYSDFALVRYNSNGSLDNTFDGDGKLASAIGISSDYGYAVIEQTDGKFFAAGYAWDGSSGDFALAKYNTDGSFDNSFNGNGKLLFDVGGSQDVMRTSVLQVDCKIVVAGYSTNSYGGTNDFAVARYNADGSLDNSFDGDGKLTTAISSNNDYATGVAVQPDGKIVICGYTYNGSTYDIALARYNTNGTLDNSFDGDGKLITVVGTTVIVSAISIQTDGKILVAGYNYNGSPSTYTSIAFALFRYNADGSLDNTFNGTGKVLTNIGTFAYATSMVLQPDGKIVVVGYSYNGLGSQTMVALARYNTNGTLDNSFDGDGKVTASVGTHTDQSNAVTLQTDGKVVVAGYSQNNSFINDFAVARFNSDGSLDNSFDGDGKLTTSFGSLNHVVRSVGVQTDGKIIAAGDEDLGDIVIARYNSDGTADNTFGNSGQKSYDLFGQETVGNLLLATNGFYVGGSSNRNDNNDFFMLAINNAGSILPLHFISFSGAIIDGNALLNWKTENEVNTLKFIIERSTDGANFVQTGAVGSYNSPGIHQYNFTDPAIVTLNATVVYYRLKQIDIDGHSTYSRIIALPVNSNKDIVILYPNPATAELNISLSSSGIEKIKYQVIDINGRILKDGIKQLSAGANSFSIDVDNLTTGSYYLMINGNLIHKQLQFVKE